MTDQATAPYDAGDAAPAVGYRLRTVDEAEQLRAEVARLRAELERYRRLAGEHAAALVRLADETYRLSVAARRQADAEPSDAAQEAPADPAATDGQGERPSGAQEALQRAVDALGEIMAMPWETGECAVRCARWVPESTVQRWREIHAAAMDALAGEGRDG